MKGYADIARVIATMEVAQAEPQPAQVNAGGVMNNRSRSEIFNRPVDNFLVRARELHQRPYARIRARGRYWLADLPGLRGRVS